MARPYRPLTHEGTIERWSVECGACGANFFFEIEPSPNSDAAIAYAERRGWSYRWSETEREVWRCPIHREAKKEESPV